jgi:hypothetical protein
VTRWLVLAALTALAVAVALWLLRRRPDAPTAPSYTAPTQLDRADFTRPEAPWLVVVFASTACDACRSVWEAVAPLEAGPVAVQQLIVQDDATLHRRYRVGGVPTTVVADAEGVVRASWLGPVGASELWGELARLRATGGDDGAPGG